MNWLNLKGFKKVAEDQHSAKLAHENGKAVLLFAKSKLTPAQRKQIEALELHEQAENYAEGGEIPTIPMSEPVQESVPQIQEAPTQGPYEVQVEKKVERTPAQEEEKPIETEETLRLEPPKTEEQAKALNNGLQMEQEAVMGKAKEIGKQGQAEGAAFESLEKNLKELPTSNQILAVRQVLDNQYRQKYAEDFDATKSYWNKHSRLLAGIATGISAIGQVFGANENGALKAIEEGIHHEIEYQKYNKETAHNLWKMNQAALGNELQANLQTQNQLLLAAQVEVQKAAANAKQPIALQNAKILNAQIQQKIDMNNATMTRMEPTPDDPDPATRVNYFIKNEATRRAVADEIDKAKAVVHSAPRIYEAFELAAKDARPMTGGSAHTSLKAFIPGIETAGQKAVKVALGPTFRDREGTVNQDALNKFAARVTPNIGDSDEEVAEKLKSLDDYLKANSRGSLAKANGIDLQKFPMTNTSKLGVHPEFGGQSGYRNTGKNRAPQAEDHIQTINGVKYRKVLKDGKEVMQKVK